MGIISRPHLKSRRTHPSMEDRKLRMARSFWNGPEIDELIRPAGPFRFFYKWLSNDPNISKALLYVNLKACPGKPFNYNPSKKCGSGFMALFKAEFHFKLYNNTVLNRRGAAQNLSPPDTFIELTSPKIWNI